MSKKKSLIASPRFAKIERIGSKCEGTDIFIMIDGVEKWMPWQVAQMFVNNLTKAIAVAKRNDPVYREKVANITEGLRDAKH